MLRIYFKHDRALLTKLCRCAYDSLLIFLQNAIGLPDGVPGVVLSIHTFGDYPEKFHPHIHAIAADGLFQRTGTFSVMPRSKMTSGKNKKNFQVYTAAEFIAAITQHIPEKSFQMVRYYGWYSNKSRGLRKKQGNLMPDDQPPDETDEAIEVIDVSEYRPRRIPSKQWRECIRKIYEVDPLCSPNCGG